MEVGSSDFPNARTAMASPLAKSLFGIDGNFCLALFSFAILSAFFCGLSLIASCLCYIPEVEISMLIYLQFIVYFIYTMLHILHDIVIIFLKCCLVGSV